MAARLRRLALPALAAVVFAVLMTYPLALGLGNADPSFRQPMAIAVLGGLVTSTLLSLLVVPAAFTYIDDLQRGIAGLFARGAAPAARAVVPAAGAGAGIVAHARAEG